MRCFPAVCVTSPEIKSCMVPCIEVPVSLLFLELFVMWTGFIWFRIGTSGGPLWAR
jgi:hypothetical protein